jgi:hypothetical protein
MAEISFPLSETVDCFFLTTVTENWHLYGHFRYYQHLKELKCFTAAYCKLLCIVGKVLYFKWYCNSTPQNTVTYPWRVKNPFDQ